MGSHKDDILAQRFDDTYLSPQRFQTLMYMKSHHALAEPGEAVGLLAAQAVGEPSTQVSNISCVWPYSYPTLIVQYTYVYTVPKLQYIQHLYIIIFIFTCAIKSKFNRYRYR